MIAHRTHSAQTLHRCSHVFRNVITSTHTCNQVCTYVNKYTHALSHLLQRHQVIKATEVQGALEKLDKKSDQIVRYVIDCSTFKDL